MKKILLSISLFLAVSISYSQTGNSPYPVIFVHGLNSSDQTWNSILTKLSSAWNLSASHTINAVLNARGGDSTNYLFDVIIPLKDVPGNNVNIITNSSIYAINFNNFWNRNASDPRIILNSNSTPGTNQNASNQSAIFKQGYALRALIDSVLRITGSSKVILLGHSMGGLAIREYLQRTENGIHKWWVNPGDTVNGHRVAKVVTIGTPHLGTNVSIPISGIDFKSEAIRDMRISYSGVDAAYLFSNFEPTIPVSYYNKDVNCNGVVTDTITGIDSNSSDNSALPLPRNISYTWIMSNYLGLGTDLAVPLASQLLYDGFDVAPVGVADTLLTNKNHIQETGDTAVLVRGLDEPDNKDFAYDIAFNKLYSGFITLQSNSQTTDLDFYKIKTLTGGKITVNLKYLNSGVTRIALLSSAGDSLVSKNINAADDSISFTAAAGDYFIKITGSSSLNPSQRFYNFSAKILPAVSLNLTVGLEGMWNGTVHEQDTIKVFLRNSIHPFNNIDSAITILNSSGNATLNFIHAPGGNYYISLTHRNALETWSSSPVNFSNGVLTDYDFTLSQSQAFGNNQLLKAGRWCIYSGDVNNDGVIDIRDLALVDNDVYNLISGFADSDLTGDLVVDASDLLIVDNNNFNFVSTIRP